MSKNYKSPILKLALFATGLSGIVAEYILSTLATYFLGDSVFQWTMILSVMLFSMGIGSRVSKSISGNLLVIFIAVEIALSFFVSYSSLIAYAASAYTIYTGFIIYSLSIIIGFFIGLEIPLVIRLNDEFDALKVNIAAVLEMDYFGSLIGGLFFAFVGLPYFGLTYTPFILGVLNLLVALTLWAITRKNQSSKTKKALSLASVGMLVILATGTIVAKPIILHGEQHRYKDKIIFQQQSRYQKIVVTQWKNDYWLYINGNQQLSTLDEDKYHEVLVHPALQLHGHPQDVLVLGGGDGIAVKEILKYPSVKNVQLVDLDPAMTNLGKTHPIFMNMNDSALIHPKVEIINTDGYQFLAEEKTMYDAIIIDLPDPKSIELGRLYSFEFYQLCYKHLRPQGVVVTQAGSPYFATKAYQCIDTTMAASGFTTTPLHNQVVTLGEWGWILGTKNKGKAQQKEALQNLEFNNISTKWLNNEAMQLVTSFGKNIYFNDTIPLEVNRIHNPVLYQYYLKGNWDLY